MVYHLDAILAPRLSPPPAHVIAVAISRAANILLVLFTSGVVVTFSIKNRDAPLTSENLSRFLPYYQAGGDPSIHLKSGRIAISATDGRVAVFGLSEWGRIEVCIRSSNGWILHWYHQTADSVVIPPYLGTILSMNHDGTAFWISGSSRAALYGTRNNTSGENEVTDIILDGVVGVPYPNTSIIGTISGSGNVIAVSNGYVLFLKIRSSVVFPDTSLSDLSVSEYTVTSKKWSKILMLPESMGMFGECGISDNGKMLIVVVNERKIFVYYPFNLLGGPRVVSVHTSLGKPIRILDPLQNHRILQVRMSGTQHRVVAHLQHPDTGESVVQIWNATSKSPIWTYSLDPKIQLQDLTFTNSSGTGLLTVSSDGTMSHFQSAFSREEAENDDDSLSSPSGLEEASSSSFSPNMLFWSR